MIYHQHNKFVSITIENLISNTTKQSLMDSLIISIYISFLDWNIISVIGLLSHQHAQKRYELITYTTHYIKSVIAKNSQIERFKVLVYIHDWSEIFIEDSQLEKFSGLSELKVFKMFLPVKMSEHHILTVHSMHNFLKLPILKTDTRYEKQ